MADAADTPLTDKTPRKPAPETPPAAKETPPAQPPAAPTTATGGQPITPQQPETPSQQPETPPASGEQMFPEAYVKELREEAKKHRLELKKLQKAQAEAAKQEQKRQEAELREQEKWRELAETQTKQISELEGYKVKAEAYLTVITSLLETEREGLPEHIIALLDNLDPVKQLEWLAKNKSELVPPETPPATQQPLSNFNPSSPNPVQETDAERLKRIRRQIGQSVTMFGSQDQ